MPAMLTFSSDTWFITVWKLLYTHLSVYLIKKRTQARLDPLDTIIPIKYFSNFHHSGKALRMILMSLAEDSGQGGHFFQLQEVPNFLILLLATFHQVSTNWRNMELAESTGRGNF